MNLTGHKLFAVAFSLAAALASLLIFVAPTPVLALDVDLYSGEGTAEDPYLVDNRQQLDDIYLSVISGDTLTGTYFALTDDIDLSETPWWSFAPDESYPYDFPDFCGVLDGRGHSISGLVIPDGSLGGLFPGISGVVANLRIEMGEYYGGSPLLLAGSLGSGGIVVNCSFEVSSHSYRRQSVVGFLDGEIVGCLLEGRGNLNYAQWLNGCLANSASVLRSELLDPHQEGAGLVVNSRNRLSHFDAICFLNENLYDSVVRSQPIKCALFVWQPDGSFGLQFNYTVEFLIRAVPLAAILIAVVFSLDFTICRHFLRKHGVVVSPRAPGTAMRIVISHVFRDAKAGYSTVFLLCMQVGFCILFAEALAGERGIIWNFLGTDPGSGFSDFTTPLLTMMRSGSVFGESYAQGGDGSYPPLARVFFWVIACFVPRRHLMTFNQLQGDNAVLTIVALYLIVCTALVFSMLFHRIKKGAVFSECGCALLALALIFTAPYMFLIERANIMFLTLVLSCFFLLHYDSDSRLLRELSLISVAAAASIKLYPIILGFVLVREKRFADICKCFAYGFVLFFIPLLLMGGVSEITGYFSTMVSTVETTVSGVVASGGRLNFTNMVAAAFQFFGADPLSGQALGSALLPMVATVVIVSSVVSRKKWRAILACTLGLVLVPGFSVIYMGMFYCIPLCVFLCEEGHSGTDILPFVGMTLILFPVQILCTSFGLPVNTVRFFMSIGEMLLLLSICLALPGDIRHWLRSNRSSEARHLDGSRFRRC